MSTQYTLEITNTTMAPDGYSRMVFAINGQYPGPTIEADWGDTVEVTVKNSLQNNGCVHNLSHVIRTCADRTQHKHTLARSDAAKQQRNGWRERRYRVPSRSRRL